MIQKKTMALIAVASIAPTTTKAARPAKKRHAAHDAMHTSTIAPTIASPFLRSPNHLHAMLYRLQMTYGDSTATKPATAGGQSNSLRSTRKVPAFHRYSTVNRPKPVSQVV